MNSVVFCLHTWILDVADNTKLRPRPHLMNFYPLLLFDFGHAAFPSRPPQPLQLHCRSMSPPILQPFDVAKAYPNIYFQQFLHFRPNNGDRNIRIIMALLWKGESLGASRSRRGNHKLALPKSGGTWLACTIAYFSVWATVED